MPRHTCAHRLKRRYGGITYPPCRDLTGSGITYTKQWLRGATAIAGQTGNAYNMVTDDVGSMIGCTVFATNTGGARQRPPGWADHHSLLEIAGCTPAKP